MITVNGADDPAVVSGDISGTGKENAGSIIGTLRATDVEGLTGSNIFSIEVGNGPQNGSATVDASTGKWSYQPTANFNGSDAFTVTITDDFDGTTETLITITVNAQEVEPTPQPISEPETGEETNDSPAVNVIPEIVNTENDNVERNDAIQFSPESLSAGLEDGEVFVFDEAIFNAINADNRDINYNLPVEIDTDLTADQPVNIIFNLEEERQSLDIAVETNGGGTVGSNAPAGFEAPITGIYFNSGAGDDNIGGF